MKTFNANKPHVRNTKYASICKAERSKKKFALFAIFVLLILACTLLLINAQANADSNGANGGQLNEPSVTTTAAWDTDTESSTTLEGTDATLTIKTTSDAVPVTSTDADVLYLADWGCNGDAGYKDLINQSIARIKAQNEDSKFGFIGFSQGVSITSNGFTADYQLQNYVFGTFSDWSLGFDKAAEMIEARTDKMRNVEIIFLTNHANATSNTGKTMSSYEALAPLCSSFKIVAPNNAASTSILKDKLGEDNLYDGNSLNLVTDGVVEGTYVDWSHALYQANSDRVNKPIKNVSIVTTLQSGFEIKKGKIEEKEYDKIYIGDRLISNEAIGNNIKFSSSKFTSGKAIEITIKLKFNGERKATLPCTDTTTYVHTPAGAASKELTADAKSLTMTPHTVTYNADGGTGQDTPTDSKKYFKGDTVYAKDGSLLVKDDCNFGGWEASSEKGDHQVVGNAGMQFIMGSSNLELTAQYCKLFVYKEGYTATQSAFTVKNSGGLILDSSISKDSVTKIVFTYTIDTPPRATTWNASEGGLAGVKAWAEKNETQNNTNDDTYTVYYGCDDKYPSLPNEANELFKDFKNLQTIEGLEHITDTSNITHMANMFLNCSKLTSLDLSNFDTSKVEYMTNMFSGCNALTTLNVSSFNTQNVKNMSYMFYGCAALESLDLSKFNTANVKNMQSMFEGCKALQRLNIGSSFSTANVTSMYRMFFECWVLTSLDVSNFNTEKVTNMQQMFYECHAVTTLNVSSFITLNVTNMWGMFEKCDKLQKIDGLTNFNTAHVTYTANMFHDCRLLEALDVTKFNTENVTNMSQMFYGCEKLTSLDVTKFNTAKVTSMFRMFQECKGLTSLDVAYFVTSNVTTMAYMFENCIGLTSLDLSNFDTSKVTDMKEMFCWCGAFTNLNLSSFVFADSITMTDMMSWTFSKCTTESPGTIKIKSSQRQTFYDQSGIKGKVEAGKVKFDEVTTFGDNSNNNSESNNNETESSYSTINEQPDLSANSEGAYSSEGTSSSEESAININDAGITKAYADEIDSQNQSSFNASNGLVPWEYSNTVNTGKFDSKVTEITFCLKAINYGNYGTSGKITVTDAIPSGLKYVENSIKSYGVKRLKQDSGALDGAFVQGQEPKYADGKITFAVEGLSAGAQKEVTFKCQLDGTPRSYTQYVNFANYETRQFSGASNYATAEYGNKTLANKNTFNNEGEAPPNAPVPDALSYVAGATVTLPDIPKIAGYSAIRKVTDSSGKEITVYNNTFIMPTSAVTTTITWTKLATSTHKVTFTFGDDESKYPAAAASLLPVEDNHVTGTSVSVPIIAEDSYSGWKFIEWADESEASNDSVVITDDQFTMPDRDVTITGTWQKNSYSINLSAGTGPDAEDVKLPEGYPKTDVVWGSTCQWPDDAEYTGTTGTKYKFNGWVASPSLTNTSGEFTMPMQNVTFTATWNPVNTFTVTFNASGHGEAPEAVTADEGNTIDEPDEPTETGYTFGGWYKDSACSEGQKWDFDASKVYADTELFAKWTIDTFTVTFDSDGGTEVAPAVVEYGKPVTEPTTTKEGFNFVGWFEVLEDGTIADEPWDFASPITEDVDLIAKWTEIHQPTPDPVNPKPGAYTNATGASTTQNTGDASPIASLVIVAFLACAGVWASRKLVAAGVAKLN